MRTHLLRIWLLAYLWLAFSAAAEVVYPGKSWEKGRPSNWSAERLQAARAFSAALQTSAVVIVQGGYVVDEWGDTARKIGVRSVRKSFLSALYGIHVAEGRIDLGRTMGELGIDDNEPPLTPVEKQASILDLLRARSGVYHPALAETPGMKAERPPRFSQAPGSFWYYNNWDFNALGAIFEKLTGTRIFEEFQKRIAGPLEMEDFQLDDGRYATGKDSIHPAYPFRMSARDMARFGHLYLRQGEWRGRQIVPREWVARSTTAYSSTAGTRHAIYSGYGFMWWVHDYGFSALGAGGHRILVVPAKDLVIVHRVDNDPPQGDASVSSTDLEVLMRMIIAASN